jgi:hypothetical protein
LDEGETALDLMGTGAGEFDVPDIMGKLLQEKLDSMRQASAARVIAKAIEALPMALWRDDQLSKRMDIISGLRSLGGSVNETGKSRETKETRLERMLRQELALLAKSRK